MRDPNPFHFAVPDGYNGSKVMLDGSKIVKADCFCVQLRVVGAPLLRWVRRADYDAALEYHLTHKFNE